MKNIIIISGKQYSGKDTLAKILLEKLNSKNLGFKRIGIGDAIKIEYGKKNNLSFEEIEKNKHLYRNDLINLGNWGRNKNKNYWLENLSKFNRIIVPDIRVRDEIEFFKNLKDKNILLVRVNASFEARSKRGIITNSDDNTEIELDNYPDWDIIVGLEELSKKADEILSFNF